MRRRALLAGFATPSRVAALIAIVAIGLRFLVGANTDVAWLITICEKMLNGQRLYVDLIEVNPPASAFLYMPAVAFARAIGLAPELVVDALVFVAAWLGIWLSGRILAPIPALAGIDRNWFACAVLAILTILPAQTFGEREHIAVIVLLPFFALLARRAARFTPDLWDIAAAGIGAGVAIAIKPHFAIAIGLAILVAARAAKSWRLLFTPENWIAGAIAALYAAIVVICFPAFVSDMLPLVQIVYVPARMDTLKLVTRPAIFCWLAALCVAARWAPGAIWRAPLSVLVAGSVGFAAAYLIQGKGWPYHSYPMLAFGLIALSFAGAQSRANNEAGLAGFARLVPVAAIGIVGFVWLNIAGRMDALVEPIRRLHPHPAMLILSSDISVGHPLVRQVGGTWASRVGSLWITGLSFQQIVEGRDPDEVAKLRRYIAQDRDMLVADIRRATPDIIVIERDIFDWEAWAASEPLVARELEAYRRADVIGTFVILQRIGTAG